MTGTSALPEAYQTHLHGATRPDPEALRRCWEPGGTLSFPYAGSVGTATRLEGIDEIIGYFGDLALFGPFVFSDVRAVAAVCGDEITWVAEMHGSSRVLATDAPYEQDYVVRFGLSARGRLNWMREYWDPTRF